MKKTTKILSVSVIVCLLLSLVLLTACGNDEPEKTNTGKRYANQDNTVTIDVDLTTLSSTMVYAKVYDMTVTNPKQYLGKTVKAKGPYSPNGSYHYVVIADATACCQQGIEFIWNGHSSYPKKNEEIEIVGIYRSYNEGSETYYYIDVTELKDV